MNTPVPAPDAQPSTQPAMVKVWDVLVRLLHWSLVSAVLLAWVTSEADQPLAQQVHEWAGLTALAVIALRMVWGVIGSRHARFVQFVRNPRTTLHYAQQMLSLREPRHIGHNPLGAWMIVALLTVGMLAAGSGWLSITDRFWGEEWLAELHEFLANLLLSLAAIHVCGVLFASLRHRENLPRAMLSGRKRPPAAGDVDNVD